MVLSLFLRNHFALMRELLQFREAGAVGRWQAGRMGGWKAERLRGERPVSFLSLLLSLPVRKRLD